MILLLMRSMGRASLEERKLVNHTFPADPMDVQRADELATAAGVPPLRFSRYLFKLGLLMASMLPAPPKPGPARRKPKRVRPPIAE